MTVAAESVRIRSGLLPNLAGVASVAAVQLLTTPVYIRYLGVERYGVIGFYFTLQAVLQILDLGIAPTVNRQLARYSVDPAAHGEARHFLRTLEVTYWAVAAVIVGSLAAMVPYITSRWLNPQAIHATELRHALLVIALVCGLQFPLSFYQSGLIGLQRHFAMNGVRVAAVLCGGIAGVATVALISPTLTALFIAQAIVVALHVLTDHLLIWRAMPATSERPRFAAAFLWRVRSFAAGMTGITVIGVLVTQSDKLLLSRLVSLREFGWYVLAWVVASGMSLMVVPVFNTLFPQLSALVAAGDDGRLRSVYYDSWQLLILLVVPFTTVIACFSHEVFLAWIGAADTAIRAAPILSILIIGSALNGLMYSPYALQLAHGATSLALSLSVFQLVTFVPALVFLAIPYGAVGAAAAWPIMNVCYLIAGIFLTHRRFRIASMPLARDIALPLLVAIAIPVLARKSLPMPGSRIADAILVIAVLAVSFVASAVSSRAIRSRIAGYHRPPHGESAAESEAGR